MSLDAAKPAPALRLGADPYDPEPVAEDAAFEGRVLHPRSVFLIHGYNTRADKARGNVRKFERALVEASNDRLAGALVRVTWPGYEGSAAIPSVYFAKSAGLAMDCVDVLARFLKQRLGELGPEPHVVLVAHSLGCLLATRVAESLATDAAVKARVTLVLMAAAIPVSGSHGPRRDFVTRAVLFSPQDRILRWTYPLGQFAFDGHWSEAVGLNGRPEAGVWDRAELMPGHGHRDYWQSRAAAEFVSHLLGFRTDHGLPEAVPVAVADPPERILPPERVLPEYPPVV